MHRRTGLSLTDVNFLNDAAVIVDCDALPRGHVELRRWSQRSSPAHFAENHWRKRLDAFMQHNVPCGTRKIDCTVGNLHARPVGSTMIVDAKRKKLQKLTIIMASSNGLPKF
jgi:hypothetical protein